MVNFVIKSSKKINVMNIGSKKITQIILHILKIIIQNKVAREDNKQNLRIQFL